MPSAEVPGDTGAMPSSSPSWRWVWSQPSLIQFSTVPIWVQFHKIPFYLLSKDLAKQLGEKVGDVLLVDGDTTMV
jgi:hypothetical protein